MKNVMKFLLIAWSMLFVASAGAQAKIPTKSVATDAISISIQGMGPAVDGKAYGKVRRLIGLAVANGSVDKFLVLGYGREGGFSGCVAKARTATSNDFRNLLKDLKAVNYNKLTTAYEVAYAKTCSEPVTPKIATVKVYQYDGGKQCEGGGIALATMQATLESAKITVYSAVKQADGMMRIAMCGADNGIMNVYEIAETDLDNALSLGFSELTE